ncbi:MAG TPA: type IV pilus assembly protein PilM [Candidatus Binatia bacterium]|nr:type IV pilus assembly protein PilM [Candidatus Binatia bacterium]
MLSFLKNINFGFLPRSGGASGYVALDIGSSSIKMVEAAVDKSGHRILNLGILPLPAHAIQNAMVVDAKPVVDTIRRLMQENGVKAKQVIAAVPGRAVIMKKVQMPKQEPAELEANIEFEAQNVIPENLDNVNLDHQVLNESDDGNRMEVLLVAVKKEIVNSYTDAIEEAGLTPAVMDVDYFALENMYEVNYSSETESGVIGLIHIGAQYTSITLLQNGVSTFTGDLSMGGAHFTEQAARLIGVGREAAEAFKITGVLEGKQGLDLEAILRPATEELAEEIRRTVSLYGAVPSDDDDGLKTIYLSGGGAKLRGLRALLEQHMAVPVKMSEPFRAFTVNKNIDRSYLLDAAPYFAVGAGLSIRSPGDK